MSKSLPLVASLPFVTLALLTGACGGGTTATPPAPQAAATPAPEAAAPAATPAPEATPDAASLQAILATADASDGTTDNVVSKCAGCRLGMPGHAEHSLQAHGYTLHFCSDSCKSTSEPKIDQVIAALR